MMNRSIRLFSRIEGTVKRSCFSTLAVQLSKLGHPQEAYKLVNVDKVDKLAASEVSLKFLAAPINPADFNVAEGTYGTSKQLPITAGNEGVARVEKVGESVKGLKEGDWVLPHGSIGTWTQSAKAEESKLVKISNNLPVAYAATIAVNPCTAYRLLQDFQDLKPGDVIMQNCANSMVGLAVVQMAREMGVKTINIIRSDRPEQNKVLKLLDNLGGDINITDEYLNSSNFHEMLADLPPCKLAFNGAGGDVVTNMCRAMAPGGTVVTYGGMSRQPLTIPSDLMVYKQLKLKGFWMSKWIEQHSVEERTTMLDDISQMIMKKNLSFFFEMHDLDDFNYALGKSLEPFHFRKVVLNLDYPDRLAEHDKKTADDYEMFEAPLL